MAAKLSNPRDLLLALLADLLYVERRLAGEVLPAVIRAVVDEELRSVLAAHLDETRAHVERAETAFRRVDAAPSANLSRGFEGLVTQHDHVAPLVVLPALADVVHAASALHVEHDEIAGYTAAIGVARALGREDVAALLEESLADETRAAVTVRDALCRLATTSSADRDPRYPGRTRADT